MLRIRVKMPDGSAWDVPAEYVAEQRAVVLEGLFDLALAVRQWRRTGNQAPLMDLAHAIEKHAPPVSGATNVEHAQRCLRCLMDGRQAPVTLRAALATAPTPTSKTGADYSETIPGDPAAVYVPDKAKLLENVRRGVLDDSSTANLRYGDPATMQIDPQNCKVTPEDGELRKAAGDPAAADDAGARREGQG